MNGIRVHNVGFAEMIAPVLQPLGEFTVFSGSFGIPLDDSLKSEEEIEAFEEAWLAKLRELLPRRGNRTLRREPSSNPRCLVPLRPSRLQ